MYAPPPPPPFPFRLYLPLTSTWRSNVFPQGLNGFDLGGKNLVCQRASTNPRTAGAAGMPMNLLGMVLPAGEEGVS